MKTVLLHANTFARLGARLKSFERQIDVIVMEDTGIFRRVASGAVVNEPQPEIVCGNADAWFSPAVRNFMKAVVSCPHLDWFQSAAAGVENPALMMIGRAAKHYTTNHRQAESMAEWALWQALDFLRRGPEHRSQAARGEWSRLGAREMAGSQWLVIGYGAIGEAVGKRVSALGGVVTGMRRSGGEAPGAARLVTLAALERELGRADVVLLAMPHTPETENFANSSFFSAMKQEALFMNLGRGALVDEAALASALTGGRPAFAALDVTREEPLPSASPLWKHPRIAITPHDSADTPGTIQRTDETFLENLRRYLAGEPLMHLVDRSVFEGA